MNEEIRLLGKEFALPVNAIIFTLFYKLYGLARPSRLYLIRVIVLSDGLYKNVG